MKKERKETETEMKTKLHLAKGFTMAELLIVVAIIAVLVAVAIPVFGSQLEKAREAADESNLRALYAELSAAVLTGEVTTPAVTTGHPPAKSWEVKEDTDGKIVGTAIYEMTQGTKGFAGEESNTGKTISIGGVIITNNNFDNGDATITVYDDGRAPTISIAEKS